MKDPLQQTETPYEILGVEPGVSDSDLRLALFNAIKKKIQPAKAREAYNTLLRPTERAKIGLTQYDPESLKCLVPCPLDDLSSLELENRISTAIAWEERLRESFPDVGTIHSLAVFWYWWAHYEEQRYTVILDAVDRSKTLARGRTSKRAILHSICQTKKCNPDPEAWSICDKTDCQWRNDCCPPAPPLEKMWQKVIAYWSTLEVMPDFWLRLKGLSTWDISGLKKSFMGTMHGHLLDLSRQYSDKLKTGVGDTSGDKDVGVPLSWGGMSKALQEALAKEGIHSLGDILRISVEKLTKIKGINTEIAQKIRDYARKMRRRNADLPQEYYMLAQLLRTEQQTAEAVIEVGVKRRNGKDVRCGVLMLTDLGYLEAVKIALEAKLLHIKDNPKLNSLKRHLSPHIYIILLLDEEKADAALEAIECLPDEQRESEEVKDLLARASHIKAKHKASVERYDEALENWRVALETAQEQSLIDDIRSTIISRCKSRAASLQRLQPDLAITILDGAYQIVEDDDIGRMLGDTLAVHAIDVLNRTYKKIQEKGVSRERVLDLRQAVAYLKRGSLLGSKTAKDNLDPAQNTLKSAESGMLSLPREVLEYVKKGTEAATRQQWQEAVNCFRQALEMVEDEAPEDLKKNLAASLTNNAVAKLNVGMQDFQKKIQLHDNMVRLFLRLGNAQSLYPSNVFANRIGGGARFCQHCGAADDLLSGYGSQFAQVNHPQCGTFRLCPKCAQELNEIINRRPKPDQSLIDLLKSVSKELYEAVDLDPTGEYPKKSLNDLRNLARNLGVSLPPRDYPRRQVRQGRQGLSADASQQVNPVLAAFIIIIAVWIMGMIIYVYLSRS